MAAVVQPGAEGYSGVGADGRLEVRPRFLCALAGKGVPLPYTPAVGRDVN